LSAHSLYGQIIGGNEQTEIPPRPVGRNAPVNLPEENDPKSRRRMTFGLAGLFLVTFVVCIAAAGGYYLVKTLQQGIEGAPLFVLAVTAAPVLVLVVFSAAWHVLAWLSRRR
jgi:hypothetical protein